MSDLGFGIVGAGVIAPTHIAAIKGTEGARLVAISDAVPERAEQMGRENSVVWYTDYTQMLGDPAVDVVCVCTPSGLRGEVIAAAAKAGKHIVAEKPVDVTLEKVDAAIAACDRTGVKLAAIMQNRFMEGVQTLKRLVDEGRLGKLVTGSAYVKWHRPQSYYDSGSWRGTWALDGGGALMNQAIHYVDLLQWMMGPVDSLFGVTSTVARKIEVEDTAVACIRFANGALGSIEAGTAAYPGMPARLEIRGEKGTVIIEDGTIVFRHIEGEKAFQSAKEASDSVVSNPAAVGSVGHQIQIADLVQAIKEDRAPMVDGREARKAIQIILAIYESSRSSCVISLQETMSSQ